MESCSVLKKALAISFLVQDFLIALTLFLRKLYSIHPLRTGNIPSMLSHPSTVALQADGNQGGREEVTLISNYSADSGT